MNKVIHSEWYPSEGLLTTTLTGVIQEEDIYDWEASLYRVAQFIPRNATFKALINLLYFEATDFTVHHQFRKVLPLFLSDYGYRIGYLDLFSEAIIELRNERNIQCVAVAVIHHNEFKMKDYNSRFGNKHEQYFADPAKANSWIENISAKSEWINHA